ncbi:hypothetical protein FH972_016933 [Carpinus fangiana]|uniref:Uncharacterized protein n=1 Tax=Carpinus fangiana TaxID=176857 RepID=A0A5N6RJF4_9ROSI|nr:hypothetical protein FH972_016933 [Carpinus fangiana]
MLIEPSQQQEKALFYWLKICEKEQDMLVREKRDPLVRRLPICMGIGVLLFNIPTALIDTIYSMAEGCCSSTSVADPVVYLGVINICFSSGQECYTLPVSSSYLSSNPLAMSQPFRRKPWGIRSNPWLGEPFSSPLLLVEHISSPPSAKLAAEIVVPYAFRSFPPHQHSPHNKKQAKPLEALSFRALNSYSRMNESQ